MLITTISGAVTADLGQPLETDLAQHHDDEQHAVVVVVGQLGEARRATADDLDDVALELKRAVDCAPRVASRELTPATPAFRFQARHRSLPAFGVRIPSRLRARKRWRS